MGWGLATLSFDRYKIAQTLLGRSCILCFETVLRMNKNKVNLEVYSEKCQKEVKSVYGNLYFKTEKYGGTKLLHLYIRAFEPTIFFACSNAEGSVVVRKLVHRTKKCLKIDFAT